MNTTLKKTLTALAMAALGATVGCSDKSSEAPEAEGTTGAEATPEAAGGEGSCGGEGHCSAEKHSGEAMPAPEGEPAPAPEGEPAPSP